MESFKICIGTNDNRSIANTHLGDTSFFNIYELYNNQEFKFVKQIVNSSKDMDHSKEDKMRSIIRLIGDVEVLVSKQKSPNFIKISQKTKYLPIIVKADTLDSVIEIIGRSFTEIYKSIGAMDIILDF